MIKREISSKDDVKFLVDAFYSKVTENSLIGPVFNRIMKVDWDKHLPIMYSFWGSILLGESTYSGNPMQKHIIIDQFAHLEKEHFDTWLKLWKETLDENFVGEASEIALTRAENIARLMQFKIQQNRV